MATYAIGDVQGCYDELRRLLDRLQFEPSSDTLWLAGDMVNRGPQSLQVLRFVKSLGKRAVCVLGNHDLHLLAISEGNFRHYKNRSLDHILNAPDREELINWLRYCPVMYRDRGKDYCLIHAGLPPQWDLATALRCAHELEKVLRAPRFHEYVQQMYGNEPHLWSETLSGMDRLRFITNCFTRLRYCDRDGNLGLQYKGQPGSQKPGMLPWLDVPGRASRDQRIICGHWSNLGYQHRNNVWTLDTGCQWGGSLTAIRVRKKQLPEPIQQPCRGIKRSGAN